MLSTLGPLEPLESLDHEDAETQVIIDQQVEPRFTENGSRERTGAVVDADNASDAPGQQTLVTSAADETQVEQSQERGNPKQKTDVSLDDGANRAGLNTILEGFKALLWAELEKVNARYEAQERVAGVNLERLNASVSSAFCSVLYTKV